MKSSRHPATDPKPFRPPDRGHARSAVRALVAALALLCGARAETASGTKPSYDETRLFAIALQRDYAARHLQALVDRIDPEDFDARIFTTPYGVEPHSRIDVLASVTPMLGRIASYPMLQAWRPMIDNGSRVLECQFSSADGHPYLVWLTLIRTNPAALRIADFRICGYPYTESDTIRKAMILNGWTIQMFRDSDERDLSEYAMEDRSPIDLAMQDLSRRNFDAAYSIWLALPAEIKATPIWHIYATELALNGCRAAEAGLEHDIRAGAVDDPFLRFSVAAKTNDRVAELAAVEDILDECQQPAVYRGVKANLLVNMGRALEAYGIFRDITELTPLAGFCYPEGIRAALAAKRPDLAVDMLRRWAAITSPMDIDYTLESRADMAEFRASIEYRAWLAGSKSKRPNKLPR